MIFTEAELQEQEARYRKALTGELGPDLQALSKKIERAAFEALASTEKVPFQHGAPRMLWPEGAVECPTCRGSGTGPVSRCQGFDAWPSCVGPCGGRGYTRQ